MSRKYKLFIDRKEIGIGVLDVDQNGTANFFENDGDRNDRLLAELKRVRVDFIAANGISLSGFAAKNEDSTCFKYVTWWLCYT